MSPFRRFAVATSATVPLALAGIALATPAQAADSGGLDGAVAWAVSSASS